MKDFSPLAITSAVVGFPARLCVITRTDGVVRRFADSDTSIVVLGDTFSVVPGLQISAVKIRLCSTLRGRPSQRKYW